MLHSGRLRVKGRGRSLLEVLEKSVERHSEAGDEESKSKRPSGAERDDYDDECTWKGDHDAESGQIERDLVGSG